MGPVDTIPVMAGPRSSSSWCPPITEDVVSWILNPPINLDPSSHEARDYGLFGVVSFFQSKLHVAHLSGLGYFAAPGSKLSVGADWVPIGAIQDFDQIGGEGYVTLFRKCDVTVASS